MKNPYLVSTIDTTGLPEHIASEIAGIKENSVNWDPDLYDLFEDNDKKIFAVAKAAKGKTKPTAKVGVKVSVKKPSAKFKLHDVVNSQTTGSATPSTIVKVRPQGQHPPLYDISYTIGKNHVEIDTVSERQLTPFSKTTAKVSAAKPKNPTVVKKITSAKKAASKKKPESKIKWQPLVDDAGDKYDGKIRWNSLWNKYQVFVDGVIYGEYDAIQDAENELRDAGFKEVLPAPKKPTISAIKPKPKKAVAKKKPTVKVGGKGKLESELKFKVGEVVYNKDTQEKIGTITSIGMIHEKIHPANGWLVMEDDGVDVLWLERQIEAKKKPTVKVGGKGIDRKDMPQIRSSKMADFMAFLKKNGIAATTITQPAALLKPTQKHIDPKKVALVSEMSAERKAKPILVSKDGYIVDGHHRWAYEKDHDTYINTMWIDLGIKPLIALIKTWDGVEYASLTHLTPAAKKAEARVHGRAKYKGVFGDYDGDGILNVDDPHPEIAGDTETVEEVLLSDEIAALIVFRESQDGKRKEFVKLLIEKIPYQDGILSRTKTPYSIINKLRRKRLTGKMGITDMIGTMIVFDTQQELEKFRKRVDKGDFGKVLEADDYYTHPQAGYKAYHWNVVFEGAPVEIQAKTTRMKKIADANHTLYKEGKGSEKHLRELTDVMELADKGDAAAIKEIDHVLADGGRILSRITGSNPPPKKPYDYNRTPERREKSSKGGAKGMMASMVTRALRGDFKNYNQEQVLQLAQRFEKTRTKAATARDEKSDSKKRLSPNATNLVRWMKSPGSFDLIGVDTYKKGDATANLKIERETWWNRYGLKPL